MNGISTQTLNILSCGRVTRFGNDTSSKLNKTVAVVAYAALAALTLTLSIRISEWALKNRQIKIVKTIKQKISEANENPLFKKAIELKMKYYIALNDINLLENKITFIRGN